MATLKDIQSFHAECDWSTKDSLKLKESNSSVCVPSSENYVLCDLT